MSKCYAASDQDLSDIGKLTDWNFEFYKHPYYHQNISISDSNLNFWYKVLWGQVFMPSCINTKEYTTNK